MITLLLALAQEVAVKGAVTSAKGSMTPSDVVAVWTPAKNELRVALFPVKITKKALEEIRKDGTMFAGFAEKSPDPKKWKDWCPVGEIKFTLDEKKNVESYHFWFYGLEQKNYTHNVSQTGDAARKGVTLALKEGGFELAFEMKPVFEDGLGCDLRIKGPVVAPLEKKD